MVEEAGLETENMAESTSTLQAKLKALTHGKVDIMLDADTFKNTTQILREMSAVWDEMTDIERAGALELMGGKRQANILASVITNFETVEDVIETSMSSSGSAMAENAKWMDSIAGKSEQLTNAMQALWNDTINSDVIKWFLDAFLGVVKFVDAIGLIPSALAGTLIYFTAIKKNNPATIFKDLHANMQNYTQTVKQLQTVQAFTGNVGNMTIAQFNAGPVNAYAAAVSNLSAKQQAATLSTFGLNAEQIRAAMVTNGVTDENIRLALSEANVSQAKMANATTTGLQVLSTLKQKDAAMSQQAANFLLAHSTEEITKKMLAQAVAKGTISHQDAVLILKSGIITTSNYTQALSWKALGTAMKAAFMSNPVGMILSIISVLLPLISGLGDLIDTTEKVAQAAEEATNAYKETQSTLKDAKKTISEISGDYEKLAKGVDELGNNISLSTSEYEKYNEIVNKIADMFPTMVRGYTDEGNAIIKNKGSVEELTKAYAALQEQANMDLLLGGKDIMKNYQYTTTGGFWQWDTSTPDGVEAAKELKKIFKDQENFDFSVFNPKSSGGHTAYLPKKYEKIVSLIKSAGISKNAGEYNSDYVQRAVKEFPGIIQGIINSWESTVNAAVSQAKPLVSAYLDASLGYAGLTSDQANVMDAIASNLNEEFFNKFNGDASKMYTELETIIARIKSSGIDDDFSVTLDMQTKFNNGDATYDDYMIQVNGFIDTLDTLKEQGYLDETTVASLKVFFDIQPYQAQLESAKALLNDEGDVKVGSVLTKQDLDIVDKYKEEWLKLHGAEIPLEKLKQLIIEAKKEAGEFSVSNMIDDFDTLQSAFSKLGDAYEDFKDNGIVTADTLADISESFKNVDGFEDYIAVLGNSKSSMEDVKKALSGLATAYLSTSDVLNSLTEENEQFIISQLKAFGVVNAEEYIADIRAVQAAMAEQYGIDLSNYATVESMKRAISADIYNDILDINDDQVADLAKKYGIDLSNFASAEQAKTAIAIAQAKARALADKQSAESTAQQQANAKMNAKTVQAGDIKGGGIFGSGFMAGNKLVGMSYEEVFAAYNAGEYDKKTWKSGVKAWLDSVSSMAGQEIASANQSIQETYDQTIASLDDTYAKYSALEDYVAQYNPTLSVDPSKLGGPDSSSSSKSSKEFEETMDWVEIRLEEINEQIDLMDSKLENVSDHASKNNIIDSIIGLNKTKMSNLTAGIKKYAEYAAGLLYNIPAQYRDAAQDGAIAISEFAGDADEKTVEAIKKYREWAQKVADLKVELEDTKVAIADLAKQKFDNVVEDFETKRSPIESKVKKLEAENNLQESQTGFASSDIYKEIISANKENIQLMQSQRSIMQKTLNTAVSKGEIEIGSKEWYDATNAITALDISIIDLKTSNENLQDSINELEFEKIEIKYDSKTAITEGKKEQLEASNDYLEAKTGLGSADIYNAIIKEDEALIKDKIDQRDEMQETLNKKVENGDIKKYTKDWYDAVNAISALDVEIIKLKTDVLTTKDDIAKNAKEEIDQAGEKHDNEASLHENNISELEAKNSYKETKVGVASASVYESIIDEYESLIEINTKKREDMQKILNEKVENGEIEQYSDEWYDAIKAISDVDTEIINLKTTIEKTVDDIAAAAKKAIENIEKSYDNQTSLHEGKKGQYEATNEYMEATVGFASESLYRGMIDENTSTLRLKTKERNDMQMEFDRKVINGEIEKYSPEWYAVINAISAIDTEIINLQTSNINLQKSINELYWDKFDLLMTKINEVSDDADNLLTILSSKDMVDSDGNWTEDGIASLGLYAQKMEVAEMESKKYQDAIDDLNKNWRELGYTEEEYIAKLDDLEDKQASAIKSYQDSKDAIIDLNKERIDAIKDGIQKEIDAYSELIDKKKEELDAEKDLYDFQKGAEKQQKNIADIERQLAALAGDNSASARAKRAKLEAELAEAKSELEETYYNRSIDNQQKALDEEKEAFIENKNQEMEELDKFLKDVEKVIKNVTQLVQNSTESILLTISKIAQEYGLDITEALISPWIQGEDAIQDYSGAFGLADSATKGEIVDIESDHDKHMDDVENQGKNAKNAVDTKADSSTSAEKAKKDQGKNTTSNYGSQTTNSPNINGEDLVNETYDRYDKYTEAEKKEENKSDTSGGNNNNSAPAPSPAPAPKPEAPSTQQPSQTPQAPASPSVGGTVTVKTSATHFGSKSKNAKMASFVPGGSYTVYEVSGDQILIGRDGAYTGWVNKKDLQGYAKGTLGVGKDQFAWIDELGEELVMHADNSGKLAFLSKGSSVIPHDITENLMELGQLDPSDILNRNRPQITPSKSIVNNNMEIHIDASVGELIHVDHLDGNNLAEINKLVDKAWDKKMQGLNSAIKKFVR